MGIRNKYYPSKYKHVGHEIIKGGRVAGTYEYWFITLSNYSRKRYKTERDAAIAVDKILISQGKEPINVLKKIVKK